MRHDLRLAFVKLLHKLGAEGMTDDDLTVLLEKFGTVSHCLFLVKDIAKASIKEDPVELLDMSWKIRRPFMHGEIQNIAVKVINFRIA